MLSVGERLTHAGDRPGNGDLVGHLGVLAEAGGAFVKDALAHGPEQG